LETRPGIQENKPALEALRTRIKLLENSFQPK